MKFYLLGGAVLLAILGLFLFYKEAKNIGKTQATVKEQEIKIEVQNEIIKENKAVNKRRTINNSVPTSDNIIWLQDNFCTDCKD